MSSLSSKSESKIQAEILSWLNSQELFCFKVIAANKRGIPDICCVIAGSPLFFEVKAANGKLHPLQEYQIGVIERAGGQAYVVRSLDEVKAIISEINESRYSKTI